MFDSRGRCSSPFPSHRASVLSEDNLPWPHGQCDLDTECCYLPTEVVPIYLLTFARFRTARLAGAGTSDGRSLHHVDSILRLLVFWPCSTGCCGLAYSATMSLQRHHVPPGICIFDIYCDSTSLSVLFEQFISSNCCITIMEVIPLSFMYLYQVIFALLNEDIHSSCLFLMFLAFVYSHWRDVWFVTCFPSYIIMKIIIGSH